MPCELIYREKLFAQKLQIIENFRNRTLFFGKNSYQTQIEYSQSFSGEFDRNKFSDISGE